MNEPVSRWIFLIVLALLALIVLPSCGTLPTRPGYTPPESGGGGGNAGPGLTETGLFIYRVREISKTEDPEARKLLLEAMREEAEESFPAALPFVDYQIDKAEREIARPPTPEPEPEPEPEEPDEPEYTRLIRMHGGGFLWKPISERGTLVVLTPGGSTGQFARAEIRRVNGDQHVADATYSGVHNGNRDHWRFGQPGIAYGDGLVFRAWFKPGISDAPFRDWAIPEGGARIE